MHPCLIYVSTLLHRPLAFSLPKIGQGHETIRNGDGSSGDLGVPLPVPHVGLARLTGHSRPNRLRASGEVMIKHTPGPWFTTGSGRSRYVEAKINGALIQEIAWCGETLMDEQEDNARLIAAAPDLLEALLLLQKEMIDSGNGWSKDYGWSVAIRKSQEAIAKAMEE
jgi:hypothetical protein